MNRENFETLAQYFENGAPHINFDMDTPIDLYDADEFPKVLTYNDTPVPIYCGSTACIAGAAAMMSGKIGKLGFTRTYQILEYACEWLGIDFNKGTEYWEDYPLFYTELDATAADAAKAIRAYMNGNTDDPWGEKKKR